ncbi:ankyrin-2b isoform X1 [Cheilinus undulatus]|uniref:ankyrin-2b isoform X1 n=1 Tax=Cheilinus undulatus TaxID=241271 RepID=UPI001BD20800|nr:ankyrin-2b isoform X1 [Cheilinus undulatus]
MTDFEESLIECDQAEQDFQKLSMELLETTGVSEKTSAKAERLDTSVSSTSSVDALTESVKAKPMSGKHMAEVSRRLYKVLYGYDVDQEESESENASVDPMKSYPDEMQVGIKVIEDEPLLDIDVEEDSVLRGVDVKYLHGRNQTKEIQATSVHSADQVESESENVSVYPLSLMNKDEMQAEDEKDAEAHITKDSVLTVHGSSNFEDTAIQAIACASEDSSIMLVQKTEVLSPTSFVQVSHDSTLQLKGDNLAALEGAESSLETMRSVRPDDTENEVEVSLESSLVSVLPESPSETSCEHHIFVLDRSPSPEYFTETSILLTESRASSPDSESSVNELNFLTPDSPVPQFRPLSPLPPPALLWETEVGASVQALPSGKSLLLTTEAEERPLTPMISNKRPFGRPLSQGSDYSGERSISPELLLFDKDDRAMSPESVISETIQWFFISSEYALSGSHEIIPSYHEYSGSITEQYQLQVDFRQLVESRPTSPESVASVDEFKALPPDSPIPEFTHNLPELVTAMIGERSSSPESACSHIECGSVSPGLFSYDVRASSPASVASGDDYKSPSVKLVEYAKELHELLPADDDIKPAETLETFTINQLQNEEEPGSDFDEDWVVISSSDIEERPLSPQSDHTLMPPNPEVLDGQASTPESAKPKEHVVPDQQSLHDPVLSDIKHEVVSHFKGKPLSLDCGTSLSYSEPLQTPLTDLAPDKEVTLELKGAAISMGEASASKELETKTSIESNVEKLKTREEISSCILSNSETEAPKTSVEHNEALTDQNLITLLAGTEVLSRGVTTEELSQELLDEDSKEEIHKSRTAKSAKKKKSKKQVKTEHEPEQKVTGTESSDFMTTAIEETKEPGRGSSPVLFSESLPEDTQSSASVQHEIPVPLPDCSVPGFSLTYDAELWKLISQIHDPQYAGEIFTSKTAMFHFTGTRAESYQPESDVRLGEEALQLESFQRSLSPDSEAEYRPMSPQSLLLMYASRPDSSSSGRSVDSQRALTPDSPTPQFFASVPEHIYHRSVSTESVLSDVETDFDISYLYDERPASPDSITSLNMYRKLSPDSPIPEFGVPSKEPVLIARLDRSSSVESVLSDVESGSVYSLLYAGSRPSSPGSVNENGPLSPESPIPMFGQALPELSVWPTDERSSSPVSVSSDVEYGLVSFTEQSTEMRPSSPDSAVSGDDFRGDSPIPDFKPAMTDPVASAYHRSSSPESAVSDVEDGLSSIDVSIFQQRPESRPSSPGSVNENGPLSPESPIPMFGQALPEFSVWPTDERSSSPVSVSSDVEYGLVSSTEQSTEMRPSSPDSAVSGDDFRGDSPMPDFKPTMTDPGAIAYHRSSSPESAVSDVEDGLSSIDVSIYQQRPESRPSSPGSVIENAPLSSESPIPQFGVTLPEFSVWPIQERSSSPASVSSDLEYEAISFTEHSSEMRPSSPDSAVSGDDYRTDSPIPDFKPGMPESLAITYHRSSSLESAVSDVEYVQSRVDIWEQRPDSPEAQVSETEVRPLGDSTTSTLKAIRVPVYRLVYDADLWKLISRIRDPQYVGETFASKTGVFEYAGTRIEYVQEDSDVTAEETEDDGKLPPNIEEEPVTPMDEDRQLVNGARFKTNQLISQINDPHYTRDPVAGLAEDLEDAETFGEEHIQLASDAEQKGRSMSPDSEAEYVPLSPEDLKLLSVLRSDSLESRDFVEENRSLSPDSPVPQFSAPISEPVTGYQRAPSSEPESDSELDHLDFTLQTGSRLSSPESDAQLSKHRPLSPDSPVPDFRPELQHPLTSVTRSRSSSPESGTSDLEDLSVYLPSDFRVQERPDSPDSVTSETNLRPLSPESDTEFRPMSPESAMLMSELRASSPDSASSVNEFRALSADSPIPQFEQDMISEFVAFGSRPSSPLSLLSDAELDVTDMDFIEDQERYLTPDSEFEFRALSPDSPIPEYRPNLLSPTPRTAECRSISPESVWFSDIDYMDELFDLEADDNRPSSPDSAAYGDEGKSLPPDSPVPQFRPKEAERFPSFVGFRPSSPISPTTSDIEYAPSISSPLDTEARPLSPESLELENEDRPLSPDSEAEYRPFSPTSLMFMSNFRSSSPDSTGSVNKFRALSPDSPIPEFRQVLQESLSTNIEWRSSSPESMCSDLEAEQDLDFPVFEDRPSSPESLTSVSKYRLSPDSPIPDFRKTLLKLHKDFTAHRSSSPESADSDDEYRPLISQFDSIERAESPQSRLSDFDRRCLSPDSPLPEYTTGLPSVERVRYGSISPESDYIDEDLETDLCIPWLFENRASSPGSVVSNEAFRRLSPVSPIPEFVRELPFFMVAHFASRSCSPASESSEIEYAPLISQMFDFEERRDSAQSVMSDFGHRCLSPDSPVPEYTLSLLASERVRYRSTSPDSEYVDEDLETDLCIPWLFEDRASSPGSTASNEELRPLRPDSPIPQFTPKLHDSYDSYVALRSCSPVSEASEIEYAHLTSEIFDFEERPDSRQSVLSKYDHRCLSPDSPLPQYTTSLQTMERVRYRSTSPESEFVDEDLETDLCIPWLFEERALSPDSVATNEMLGRLLSDSPIPEFAHEPYESTLPYMHFRSTSPESVLSDWDIDLSLSTFSVSRPTSPESLESTRLSPDSPIPHFTQPVFELPETMFGCRSASPESTCSDVEYVVLSLGSFVCDHRLSSPSSGGSMDEYRALSPDSPIPDYTPQNVIVNVGFRSTSPESVESDIEYALSELLVSMSFDGDDRPDSPESVGSEVQERPLSVESLPEYKPLSPAELKFLRNIRSVSPESTQSLDGHRKLSPDSPLPWFTQNVLETMKFETRFGCLSPESVVSDKEYGSESYDLEVADMTPLSPQSERSDDEPRAQPPESPIPDYTRAFVENITTWRDLSQGESSDSEDLSQTFDQFCLEYRQASPESIESEEEILQLESKSELNDLTATEASIESTIISAEMEAASAEEAVIMEYNLIYEAELWKLISQVRDPQYAGETYASKTGFMQFIGSTVAHDELDSVVKDSHEQDAYATVPPVEEAQPLTRTDIETVDISSTSEVEVISSEPAPESPPPMIEPVPSSGGAPYRQAEYAFEKPSSDDDRVVVSVPDAVDDDVCGSPDSLAEFRPMSPSSVMLFEARASSPESAVSVNELRQLSPDSPLPQFTMALPECVSFLRSSSSSLATLASDIEYMPDLSENVESQRRASSPESMPEFSENRSLSPDSPIPQFSVSVDDYTTIHRSSSLELMDSDSECELVVTSSRVADTDRPSSPESIASISEFRHLLPDSPVPEFMRILSSYFMDAPYVDRSSSPLSFTSDSEFVALPIDCWIDDSPRPMSPQSVDSEDELDFSSERFDKFVSEQEFLSHGTPALLNDQSISLHGKKTMDVSPLLFKTEETDFTEGQENPDLQKTVGPQPDLKVETLETAVFVEDLQEKLSSVQDEKNQEKEILDTNMEELKGKTDPLRDHHQIYEEAELYTDTEVQSDLLPASTAEQDSSKIDEPITSVLLQLPDKSSYTTHRTVTPILPSFEKTSSQAESCELFSPMSTQFLIPPDYEAVFSGHQTLRVSECSQASLNDLSPLSPVFSDSVSAQVTSEAKEESENPEEFEFSPGFKKVLSEFEKTVSEFESDDPDVPKRKLSKGSESPQLSESDVEFFDCRQAFSDFSDPEDVKLDHEIVYHISEPPSPLPGSSLDLRVLKGSPQLAAHPFLRVEDYKRFSSGSESLGDFAYDSEGSRECRAEGDLPVCEELPSRDQAGYYDDDDFLGREIEEELGFLSSDSSEEEVLTTRVVRRRVIIQADNLPDIPPQTVTEEKYTDEHGNMVIKKITRKVIHKYVSPDGLETQEVTIEGSRQESVQIEEGDTVSRVVKRTVLHSEGDQKELTFSEPLALGAATTSEFEAEPVQGRKVSKVVKTTVVRGERMEKQTGDVSLSADLPSAREDFEKKPNA